MKLAPEICEADAHSLMTGRFVSNLPKHGAEI